MVRPALVPWAMALLLVASRRLPPAAALVRRKPRRSMNRDKDDGMGGVIFEELFMRSDRQGLQISEPENSLFLAAKETVERELVALSRGQCRGDDQDMDPDVNDFGVIRQGCETETEGKNDQASGKQSQFGENPDDNPDADGEKGETDAFGIEIASPGREKAVRAHETGDLLALLVEVIHVEGGVGTVAGAELVDACHKQTETDPETEQEIGGGEGAVATGGLLFGFGHGFVGLGLAWLCGVGEFEKVRG